MIAGHRIVAVLIGVAISLILTNALGVNLYVALALGLLGYLIARYAGWAIKERRGLEREKRDFLSKR